MGVVYKAEDTKLKRTVALKFLPSHLATSEQDKSRFIQEAQAAAALNHPNVCTIYGIEEHNGQMSIAMEFVDGQTLRDKRGMTSFKQAIDIGIQIADGLAAAHEKGIVHRDIKPENIMVRKDGIAQIMDFGLAKLRTTKGVSRLTREGSTVGTAAYMSPEQVQGQDADHRSDIFSLGVLLYELFAGSMPFKGVHETALMYEIVNVDPPPPSAFKPEIGLELDRIVLECMEKDPNERTQSVKQIAIDLKRFKRESGGRKVSRIDSARTFAGKEDTGTGKTSLLNRLLWPVIAGLLAVALGVAGFTLWKRADTTPLVYRFDIHLPKDQVLDLENTGSLAISPDGSTIVYRSGRILFQRRMQSAEPQPISGTEDGASPFFSPDGNWLAFFAGGKVKKVPLRGGAVINVADAVNNRGGTWSRDGSIIFTPSGRAELFIVPEDGGEVRRLTTVDSTKNERTHRWPQALPDGKNVIFTLGTLNSPDYYEDATIAVQNIQTGEKKVIIKGASYARYVPAGYILFAHEGTIFAVRFDLDRLEVIGVPIPLIENVSGDVSTGIIHFDCSATGTAVFAKGPSVLSKRLLALTDWNGKTTTLGARPATYVDPRLSPDGTKVAVGVQTANDFDLWIYDIPRNTMNRLTFDGANRSPAWSPDGKRIAYSHNDGNNASVIIRDADGSSKPEEFKINADRSYVSCWTKDGSALIVTIPSRGLGWDIWVQPLIGDRTMRLFLSTTFDEAFANVSPNGKWIAYLSNESGPSQLYVRPFPQGDAKWQISMKAAVGAPRWSRDGKTLFYIIDDNLMAVPIEGTQSLTAGQASVVLKNFSFQQLESAMMYDVSANGEYVLSAKPQGEYADVRQLAVVVNWFDEIEKSLVPEK